jgi:hypothetical protein
MQFLSAGAAWIVKDKRVKADSEICAYLGRKTLVSKWKFKSIFSA